MTPPPPRPRRSAGRCATLAPLTALLIALAPGCYFFLPLVEVEANQPPVILDSDPPEGAPLVFDLEVERPFVVVEDEGAVEFHWSISGGIGTQGGAEPIGGSLQGSQLSLSWDDSFEGRTLRVTVYDVEGESTAREWVMESIGP
jgi:hypothetical protein